MLLQLNKYKQLKLLFINVCLEIAINKNNLDPSTNWKHIKQNVDIKINPIQKLVKEKYIIVSIGEDKRTKNLCLTKNLMLWRQIIMKIQFHLD